MYLLKAVWLLLGLLCLASAQIFGDDGVEIESAPDFDLAPRAEDPSGPIEQKPKGQVINGPLHLTKPQWFTPSAETVSPNGRILLKSSDPPPPPQSTESPPPPESTAPPPGPKSPWDEIKHNAGAVAFCKKQKGEGECQYLYSNDKFGKCANLDKIAGNYDNQISSIQIGAGGQCCFWGQKGCTGMRKVYVDPGPDEMINLKGSQNDAFRSFSCWGSTAKINGL